MTLRERWFDSANRRGEAGSGSVSDELVDDPAGGRRVGPEVAAATQLDRRLGGLATIRAREAHAVAPQAGGLGVEVVDLERDVVETGGGAGRKAGARVVEAEDLQPPGAPGVEGTGQAVLGRGELRHRIAQPEDVAGEGLGGGEILHEEAEVIEAHGASIRADWASTTTSRQSSASSSGMRNLGARGSNG